jgi:hypothetical protein
MGLDIYVHRVKNSIANKYGISPMSSRDDIFVALRNESKKKFNRSTSAMLRHLRKVHKNSDDLCYYNEYVNFINRLRENVAWYGKYEWHLDPLGYNWYKKQLLEVKHPDEVEQVFNKHFNGMFAIHDAYFRKVNFLYEYFRNDMVDESCVVDKTRIGNLISICEDVLAHKGDEDYAKEKLPTTSGFFFGSTRYDEWYWYDVNDCLTQMRKLYKSMSDEDFVVWGFSW